MITRNDKDRIMYGGNEPIIFDGNPIPDYKGALESMNANDMRGVIVEANMEFMKVKVGMRGIVYETYNDFDKEGEYGWSIIFESGSYDGFSFEERKIHGMVKVIGIYPPMQDYKFSNVMQLEKDFLAGKFKFK